MKLKWDILKRLEHQYIIWNKVIQILSMKSFVQKFLRQFYTNTLLFRSFKQLFLILYGFRMFHLRSLFDQFDWISVAFLVNLAWVVNSPTNWILVLFRYDSIISYLIFLVELGKKKLRCQSAELLRLPFCQKPVEIRELANQTSSGQCRWQPPDSSRNSVENMVKTHGFHWLGPNRLPLALCDVSGRWHGASGRWKPLIFIGVASSLASSRLPRLVPPFALAASGPVRVLAGAWPPITSLCFCAPFPVAGRQCFVSSTAFSRRFFRHREPSIVVAPD